MSSLVAICTDSSSLLPAASAERLGVDVVPIAVALDGEPFDERTSSLDEFYGRLRSGAVATTSQPSPAEFAAAFDRAASRGARAAVSIHLDARTSGTVSSAEIAAQEARLAVTVVDTRTVSFGVGVCARAAAKVAAGGGSPDEIAQSTSRLGASIRNAFVARSARGGRVPAAGAWTVLSFRDGVTAPVAECTSVVETAEAMTTFVLRGNGLVSAAVGHAGGELEAAADELACMLERSERVLTVERYRVGASVGAHTGPESYGAFWWPIA